MRWINTRERLPDEGELILVRFSGKGRHAVFSGCRKGKRHLPQKDERDTVYWVCRRDGNCFIRFQGPAWNLNMTKVISYSYETDWMYISELEKAVTVSLVSEVPR